MNRGQRFGDFGEGGSDIFDRKRRPVQLRRQALPFGSFPDDPERILVRTHIQDARNERMDYRNGKLRLPDKPLSHVRVLGQIGREHFYVHGLVQAEVDCFVDRTIFFDGHARSELAAAEPLSHKPFVPFGRGLRDSR